MYSCRNRPLPWNGPSLQQPRNQLILEQLQNDSIPPLMDMSFFAKPSWASPAQHNFSGKITIPQTPIVFPLIRELRSGENVFPACELAFISHQGELIPRQKRIIHTKGDSYWDIILGTGAIWQEETDDSWSRASFPFTLTDRYMGQTRNCVGTFLYQKEEISKLCIQCSQETADVDDRQLGNMQGKLEASFQAKMYEDSAKIVQQHKAFNNNRLQVLPLDQIDQNGRVAAYFEKGIYTNASTSIGAILLSDTLYIHPPNTRHGRYPYPNDMRFGLYSVTKSMAGALSLCYLAQRYGSEIFNAKITDYVPAMASQPAWQGVSFSHCLNMVTGTVGSERAEHLLEPMIIPLKAEEAIHNISTLGDEVPGPGEAFNYASTNFFVLSYAMQSFVQEKEGTDSSYWELVRKHVLEPVGAGDLHLLHTIEDSTLGIPWLAYGICPTIDEAAKIALLFANEGRYKGRQLLHPDRVREIFGKSNWEGHSTQNDFRGSGYHHSFWSKTIHTSSCPVEIRYMLGFGENYVVFLPSGTVIFRFLDEHDLNIDKLIKSVEEIRSSCQ
ncbi:MAG: serine hydrolase [Bacteroidota bacterium]